MTVKIKVVELMNPRKIWGEMKQDVVVADGSGTARVSVWKRYINSTENEHNYCLKNFMVQKFQGTKYLGKEGSEVIYMEDIGAVVDQEDRDNLLWLITDVTVRGVPCFDKYKLCLQCKIVSSHTPNVLANVQRQSALVVPTRSCIMLARCLASLYTIG